MTIQEKTAQEVAGNLLANEEKYSGNVVMYKIDVEKLSEYSYQAIADALNQFFGPFAIDATDEGVSEKMFLDTSIGPFLSRDDEKVEIL